RDLLKRELEIKRDELKEKILFSSLEKIFIENRIYRDIEECETWEAVIETIDKGLTPFKPQFYREITEDDIVRLTEIKIKRISKFDSFKADELMKKLTGDLEETEHNLENLTDYTIAYYNGLLEKYGKGRERKTEIKSFDTINTTLVVALNQKLYVNRADGFVGWGIKKDEFVSDCSDIDDIIVIRRDGKCLVTRISDKVFVGQDILYAGVWKKGDDRMVFNLIYVDGKSGRSMVKRFSVTAVTRDKEYDLTKGNKNSRVLYLSANPNGEAEVVTVKLTGGSKARIKVFDFDFSTIEIKGRGAGGNILTKYPIRKIELKEEGTSTLGGLNLWYDAAVGRLNKDSRGEFLGKFNNEDRILVFYKNGHYELTNYELTNKYEPEKVLSINKFIPDDVITIIHYDGKSKNYYVKRFVIETASLDKLFPVITEEPGSKIVLLSMENAPVVNLTVQKGKSKETITEQVALEEVVDVKGWKAIGNRLTPHTFKKVDLVKEEKSAGESGQEESGEDVIQDVAEEVPLSPKSDTPEINKETRSEKESPRENGKKGFQPGDTIELDF
ncbi:MAG: DNA gyrase/topoisomerase IV subunit A, partial [Cyclobacteriaceae bacterium]|nr:DNA gyrase/topoisomerase IV subunit A [Cyclobacteriaceae bacterium]